MRAQQLLGALLLCHHVFPLEGLKLLQGPLHRTAPQTLRARHAARSATPRCAASEADVAVSICYCSRCNWMLRSAWLSQELLTTFNGTLTAVTLQPDHSGSGCFTVVVDKSCPFASFTVDFQDIDLRRVSKRFVKIRRTTPVEINQMEIDKLGGVFWGASPEVRSIEDVD